MAPAASEAFLVSTSFCGGVMLLLLLGLSCCRLPAVGVGGGGGAAAAHRNRTSLGCCDGHAVLWSTNTAGAAAVLGPLALADCSTVDSTRVLVVALLLDALSVPVCGGLCRRLARAERTAARSGFPTAAGIPTGALIPRGKR